MGEGKQDKHFAMTNGQYTAVSYATPVHRKDASGAWQDIDNNLSLTNVKGTEFYATGDLRAVFAKEFAAGGQLFALNENGYSIGMSLVSNQIDADATVTPITPVSGTTTVTNAPEKAEAAYYDTLEEAAAINTKSSIVYTNVKSNTDLEYILDGNDVKENIIVKSAGTSYVYRFTLTLAGLTATLNESGDIALTDSTTGEPQYTIPAPYMYDANGEVSYDVAYTLTDKGSGAYTLTVTASPEWINAADRAFPVKIDPTVTQTTYFTDTFILSTAPTTNYESDSLLQMNADTIAYFKFPMPTVPAGGYVTTANLYIMPTNLSSGAITVGAYQMLETWSASVTWGSASTEMTNMGMASSWLSSTTLTTSAQYAAIDITGAAESWYEGFSKNFGVALKYLSGTNTKALLFSADAESARRPYFTMSYWIIREGDYYIENVGNGLYMDVEGPSTANGAIIQQWAFHGGRQSRWQLIYVSNNCYRIKSVYSGLYVGVDSSNTSLIKQYSTQNSYTLWRIGVTSTGDYQISNTAFSSNNYLAAPTTSSNGTDLTTSSYSEDTEYNDEWKMHIILPLSGSELPYEPNVWNVDAIRQDTNCYSYILNAQSNPTYNKQRIMRPGEAAGLKIVQSDISATLIQSYTEQDSEVLEFVFEEIDKYTPCPAGSYKVALVIVTGMGFHWYRQNVDGSWSHKRGLNPIENTDASGHLIFDPQTTNRSYEDEYGEPFTYEFAGFFRITPLNTIYSDIEETSEVEYDELMACELQTFLPQSVETIDIRNRKRKISRM